MTLSSHRERQTLIRGDLVEDDKAEQLLSWLPKKGSHALEKFVTCLEESSDGTAHDELVETIRKAVDDVLKEPDRNEPVEGWVLNF